MFRARAAAGMFLRDEERFVIRMVFKNTPGFCFFFFFFFGDGKSGAIELCPHYAAYLTHQNILIDQKKCTESCAIELSTLGRGNR